jgi:hypothetical protein
MRIATSRLALALMFLASAGGARAQTADEVIEKSLTAIGGRAALGKLKSRSMSGTITLSTPAGEITGSIVIVNAAPNKFRSLVKVDLSALGAGELILDQRFNGTSGYVLDSLQGNHDMTGGQLENLRNGSFPHPFLNYKEIGVTAQMGGKEKVGEREAYVLIFDPTSGPVVRHYVDAETYLPLKAVLTVDVPQLGRDVEQATEFLDYRDMDGIKLPFQAKATSSIQSYTITIAKVEHNVQIDDALFSKPGAP